MNRAYIKYGILCVIGILFLVLTVVFIVRTNYTFIFVSAFVGVMIINAAGRRIIYLIRATRALEAGKKEIIIFYRDGNLNESKETIIPVWSDTNWLYGFLIEKNDIKQFRWKGIQWTSENGKDIGKDELIKYIESIP